MPLPADQADALMQRFGATVATLARAQFDRMLELVRGGMDPRKAIGETQAAFTGAFADRLAAAFSELLQRSVGTAEVRAMPIGDLVLSERLYAHNQQTKVETLALLREHAKGVQQARKLALDLYDGYDPARAPARPLERRARGELPQALRNLTADPRARADLQHLVDHGQKMAARLKTGALRAAYTETIDAWQAGAGEAALQRRLDVAVREKNRFLANRIAQTELARAHQAEVAADLMADDQVEVVQVVMNPTHPKRDICDLHARADLWSLGPGNYPKARAPQPPFHPFCHCRLRQRPSLSVADARHVPNGEAAYLRSLGNLSQAGEVMGSRGRAEAVLNGTPVDQVINAARDPLYRLRRLGDGAGHALVKPVENAAVTNERVRSVIGQAAWDLSVSVLVGRTLPPDVAAAGLSMAEKVAVYTWTQDTTKGPWFSRINRVLRSAEQNASELATTAPLIDGIRSSLKKLPAFEGTVFRSLKERGMSAADLAWFAESFQPGNRVTLSGFSGASKDIDQSLRGKFKLVIKARAGRDISSLSAKPEQGEVLLDHGAVVEIDRVEIRPNGVRVIWAHEIL